MLARRRFVNCAICAAMGLVATGASAQAPGFTRTVINRSDTPGDKYATIQVQVDIEPGTFIAWHTHPGTESAVLLEGGGELMVKGQPKRAVKAGDTFQIPVEMPHALQNGPAKARVMSVYVVEKDKPLASPAAAPA
jgi:quercetin dioxygenase-like cupin family protein